MSGFIALVHKDPDTSYGISFPDLPGCISAGDTFEEALKNAAEALAGHLSVMKADADAMPRPRSLEELRNDPSFLEDSADAVVTFVSPRPGQIVMRRTDSRSSAISEIGYAREGGELIVTFTSGKSYVYDKVPPNVFDEFMNAQSKSSYFDAAIRDRYSGREVKEKYLIGAE
jgi:predicted RNase H-like HicB family nuclease